MNYSFSDEYEYIPFNNGNRQDEKPIEVQLRYMTLPEREESMKVEYVAVEGELQKRTSFDHGKILKYSVVSLRNLTVHKQAIITAYELLAIRGLSELCAEIAEFAVGKNRTPDLKN